MVNVRILLDPILASVMKDSQVQFIKKKKKSGQMNINNILNSYILKIIIMYIH